MTDAVLLATACVATGCAAVCAYLMARMYLDRSAAGQAAALAGKPEHPRSPQWPAVRRAWLKEHPTCAACGTKDPKVLEVHHIQPFHLHPELELSVTNLETLCESPSHNCHLIWGHFLSFTDSWNPNVRQDAADYLKKLANRPIVKSGGA